MDDDNAQKAAKAREQGNALYKQGKLTQAEAAYNVAANLAPGDAAPFSNLSAVKYEKGEYADAVKFATKALSLYPEAEAAKREKVYVRLVKSHIHDLKLDEATGAAEKVATDHVRASLLADISQLRKVADSTTSASDKTSMRKHIMDRLTLFRPGLSKNLEYYAVGHDDAEPIWDHSFFQLTGNVKIPKNKKLSVLYCGIGDARNFFASIMHSFLLTRIGPFPEVHYTLLDINPASLARLMLLLELAEESGKEPPKNDGKRSLAAKVISTTMAYVYSGHIYPAFAHDRVHHALGKLIAKMEKNDKPISKWLHVPKSTRGPILDCLRNWKGPAKDCHTTASIRKAAVRDRRRAKTRKAMGIGLPPGMEGLVHDMTPESCELDRDYFDNLGFLPPPDSIASSVDPAFVPLLNAYDDGEPGAGKALKTYVDGNWKVNVTLIDMEWEKDWRSFSDDNGQEEVSPFINFDPLEILFHLTCSLPLDKAGVEEVENAMGLTGMFFDLLSDTFWHPSRGPKMTVEIVLGEMTDFMERLRYNCLEFRSEPAEDGFDPRTFPRAYDRIHLSNVTDYVGGLMNPLLFAAPLLKEPGYSDVRFTVLLNPPKFKSHEQFQAEYVLMPSEAKIIDHFHLKRLPPHRPPSPVPYPSHPLGPMFEESYFVWQLQPGEKLPWEKLMRRPQFERWLYGFFLKICLPYPRSVLNMDGSPVHAPLNLTVFFRLISHMHEVGYPAHWMSGILDTICEGTITTTTRAPTAEVMTPQEVDKVYPARKINVAPWKGEFTTLLSLWRHLFPFGISLTSGKGAVIAAADGIGNYRIKMPRFWGDQLRESRFQLVFWDVSQGKPPRKLRTLLLDDEVGDGSATAQAIRNKGIHVVSAFRYTVDTESVNFWLRKDVVNGILGGPGQWMAYIWRTDNWEKLGEGVPIATNLEMEGSWTDAA